MYQDVDNYIYIFFLIMPYNKRNVADLWLMYLVILQRYTCPAHRRDSVIPNYIKYLEPKDDTLVGMSLARASVCLRNI